MEEGEEENGSSAKCDQAGKCTKETRLYPELFLKIDRGEGYCAGADNKPQAIQPSIVVLRGTDKTIHGDVQLLFCPSMWTLSL